MSYTGMCAGCDVPRILTNKKKVRRFMQSIVSKKVSKWILFSKYYPIAIFI